LRAETAALLLSGQEGGLPLAVLALPVPGADGGPARVPVVIEVMLERVTNIAMGPEIDQITEFEEIVDLPSEIELAPELV